MSANKKENETPSVVSSITALREKLDERHPDGITERDFTPEQIAALREEYAAWLVRRAQPAAEIEVLREQLERAERELSEERVAHNHFAVAMENRALEAERDAERYAMEAVDLTKRLMGAERREAATGWQPIDTAPKDGTWMLMWSSHWRDGGEPTSLPEIGYWSVYSKKFACHEGPIYRPTHWMPLPAPPSAALASPAPQEPESMVKAALRASGLEPERLYELVREVSNEAQS